MLRLTTLEREQRVSHADRAVRVLASIAIVLIAAIHLFYVRRYFFLFDDFALVGEGSTLGVHQIVSQALFGFYRPLAFLLVKGEWLLFSWRHPAGFMAVLAGIHFANAALIFVLLRRFRIATSAALVGTALFAASPWASEAYFWLSGSFDVLSVFGVLVSLTAVATLADRVESGSLAVIVAFIGAGIAMFAKENAVLVLPLVLLVSVVAQAGVRRAAGLWALWLPLAATAIVYAIVRSRLLPDLGGAYGSLGTLFRQAAIGSNVLGYLRAFVTVPLPWVRPGTSIGVVGSTLVVIASAAVLISAWRGNPRVAFVAVIGFVAAIAPTVWMAPASFATPAGRYMYMPGLFGCALVAAAFDLVARCGRGTRRGAAIGLAAVLSTALVSVAHQAREWSRASSLARSAIDQFEPLARAGGAVFIPNMPFWFSSGPYVLKDYAFSSYFPGPRTPAVRTRNVVINDVDGRMRFGGWVDGSGLPEAAPMRIEPGERVLVLKPLLAETPLVEAEPEQMSVFATLDARRVSEATIAVSALTSWRADVEDPSLLTVEPPTGRGNVLLRVVPHPRDTPLDRIVMLTVRPDESDATVLARVGIRLRLAPSFPSGPPFGSVDAPAGSEVSLREGAPILFQGWALDPFSLRRVYGEALGSDGTRIPLGDAVRGGAERPDVAKIYPNAHDLWRASWVLAVNPGTIAPLATPATVEIYAENSEGTKQRIGVRSIRK